MTDDIKKRREELGLSLQQLADKTGIPKATLQRYETGTTKKVPGDALEKLRRVLGMNADENDISTLIEESINKLNSDLALMFDGKPIDDRTRELLLKSLKNSMEMAKIISENK